MKEDSGGYVGGEMIKVSVITVNLNNKEDLKKTYGSVIAQTYETWEHIVVDGRSSDGSLDLIEGWYAENPNLKYCSERDSGIAEAMNKGVAMAGGDLVIHLNSGDCFCNPHVLEKVVESYARERWSWAVGNLIMSDEAGVYRKKINSFSKANLEKECYLPQPSTFFSRDMLPLVRFDEALKIAMDYDLFLRLVLREGYAPVVLGFDVTHFDLSGVSQNFWAAYNENRHVRAALLDRGWRSVIFELNLLARAAVWRSLRRLVIYLAGDAAKNNIRGQVKSGCYCYEKIS